MPSPHHSKSSSRRHNHVPLADDLVVTGPLRTKSKKRKVRHENEDGADNSYVDSRSSRKILKIGQELQDDEREEEKSRLPNPAFAFESRFGGVGESGSEEEHERTNAYEEAWGSEMEDVIEEVI